MGRQRQRMASRMRREEDNLSAQEILVRDALGMGTFTTCRLLLIALSVSAYSLSLFFTALATAALGGGGRVFRDVTIPRITDEAFRVWLLNAAWLICKKAMRQRIRSHSTELPLPPISPMQLASPRYSLVLFSPYQERRRPCMT